MAGPEVFVITESECICLLLYSDYFNVQDQISQSMLSTKVEIAFIHLGCIMIQIYR